MWFLKQYQKALSGDRHTISAYSCPCPQRSAICDWITANFRPASFCQGPWKKRAWDRGGVRVAGEKEERVERVCLKESSKGRGAQCRMCLWEWGKETGGDESGVGQWGWSLRGYVGSDIYQSKHQRHSQVVLLSVIALAYLWHLGLFFFPSYLTSFLFSFNFSLFCQKAPKAQGGLMPA